MFSIIYYRSKVYSLYEISKLPPRGDSSKIRGRGSPGSLTHAETSLKVVIGVSGTNALLPPSM